jgi:hypothetical protein
MRALADRLRRPLRAQPLVAALLVALATTALIALLLAAVRPHAAREPSATTPDVPVPGPIITATPPQTTPRRAASPPDVPAARAAARRFLRSYLPVLYGRRRPASVHGVDAHLAASLRAAARAPRAPANRQPRVTALQARAQSPARVLMVATIADRIGRPYRIVFALTRQTSGRWLVSELANY